MRWLPIGLIALVCIILGAFALHDYRTGQPMTAPIIMAVVITAGIIFLVRSGGKPGRFT